MAETRADNPPSTDGIASDPRADAIRRYWQVICTQVSFSERTDTKAQHLVRQAALIVGIVLTGVSIFVRSQSVDIGEISTMAKLSFTLGIVALLSTIGFAAYTSLNSNVQYGFGRKVGHRVADGYLNTPEYEQLVLNAYVRAVCLNRRIVNVNAERYRVSLLSFLLGIYYITLSGLLSLLSIDSWMSVGAFCVATIPATWLTRHVYTGKYLVLEGN